MTEPVTTLTAPLTLNYPLLIFAIERADKAAELLRPDVLGLMRSRHWSIALMLDTLDETAVNLIRLLNAAEVPVAAWLTVSESNGIWFNAQNYPHAIESYTDFHAWVKQNELNIPAVCITVAPSLKPNQRRPLSITDLTRRLIRAQEHALYRTARGAYNELVARMRNDGYDVHVCQTPLVVEDRRAHVTLLQRAFDLVEMPADVEIIMCNSLFPNAIGRSYLSAAFISAYGPLSDGIGIGAAGQQIGADEVNLTPFYPPSWTAIEQDLLLAARYTDTIYIFSLEGCIARGVLPRIATMDWNDEPQAPIGQRVVVESFRAILRVLLFLARSGRETLAWSGWLLALWLITRRFRRIMKLRRARRAQKAEELQG